MFCVIPAPLRANKRRLIYLGASRPFHFGGNFCAGLPARQGRSQRLLREVRRWFRPACKQIQQNIAFSIRSRAEIRLLVY